MYTLKNVTKYYGNNKVLCNLNIKIPHGITVIIGPSGSGKSTLLNLLGCIDTCSEGQILYNNNIINSYNIRRNVVSYIFQNYNLFNELSVKDNIRMGNFKKNKYIKIVNQLGLKELLNKFPYELSGGEQQRVAIARSVVRNSDVILADEPTGALDLNNSLNVLKILINLQKDLIIVTHNENIKYLADTIIYINSGKIISVVNNKRKKVEDIKWV